MAKKTKKNIKVRDLKPSKDAKGGNHFLGATSLGSTSLGSTSLGSTSLGTTRSDGTVGNH